MFEIILNHRITGAKEYKAFAEMRYSMTVAMIEGICIVCYEAICCKNFLDIFMKKKKGAGNFAIPVVLAVAFMLFLLYSYQIGSSTVGYLAVSFGMVIANLILFLLLQYVSVKENEWYQVQMLHKQNKEKMQAYRESNVNYEFLKRMMHDYGNQLNCIQGLLQQKRFEQAREYTEKLTNSFHEEMNVVNVHHPIINVLLNQKYHLAEEKGISVVFQLNDLSDVWMEEQDLVVLLSNLLDNAIEASEKCDEKIIWVKIVLESQQMIVSVKNSVEKNVDIQDDLIHTTKRDAVNHGIGLKNIRLVLQKYHALGSMTCHDGYFWYTAVIPRGIQE